jgi:hypothetical protein
MRSAILIVSIVSVALTSCGGERPPQTDRQAEVAARGAEVMPFDLSKTQHVFAKDSSGGVQSVTAKDPADTLDIRLVREHLQKEAELFGRGEFGDPAAIHGDSMPGLAELRAAAGKVAVEYTELPAGAQIRFTTTDAGLRSALHRWFDAQVSDHGEHASH